MKRALGGLIVGALLVEGLIACGGNPQDSQVIAVVETPTIVQNANVTIGLLDSSGVRRGTCSGVLIGPRLVLTAGHCITGKNSWAVLSAQGTKATGIRGFTADWLDFESSAAHPAHHDFGVIQLQSDIALTAYPKLATTEAANAAALVRIRNLSGSSFEARTAFANPIDGFPHAYMTGVTSDEALDTGGAVLDGDGNIVGVISGQGTTTGNLYIARIDTHFVWLDSKVQCSTPSDESDDSTASAGQVGIQCNSSGGGSSGGSSCSSGGSSGSSSGGSSCSGGSSGGSSCSSGGGSSGSDSGGDSSGGGSSGGSTCQSSGGNCSGSCPSGSGGSVTGSDGSTTDTGSSTSGGSSGSGGSGSGSSTGSSSGSNTGSGSSGSDNGGYGSGSGSSTGSNTGSTGSGSGSNAGSNAGSTMGSNGGSTGSSGSGTGSSTGSNGGTGSLVGNNTNGGINGGSTGSTTGTIANDIPASVYVDSCENGGCPDDTIDYGDCGCTGTGGGSTTVK